MPRNPAPSSSELQSVSLPGGWFSGFRLPGGCVWGWCRHCHTVASWAGVLGMLLSALADHCSWPYLQGSTGPVPAAGPGACQSTSTLPPPLQTWQTVTVNSSTVLERTGAAGVWEVRAIDQPWHLLGGRLGQVVWRRAKQ